MTPRQFILDNSEHFQEVVCNGHDIRMEEEQWMQWMERYAHFKQAITRVLFYCGKKHIGAYQLPSVPRLGDTVRIKGHFYHVEYVSYECDISYEGFNWVHIDLKIV